VGPNSIFPKASYFMAYFAERIGRYHMAIGGKHIFLG